MRDIENHGMGELFQDLRRGLRVHRRFMAMRIAARLSYRVDFVASIGIFTLLQMAGPLFIATIYQAGGRFPGWSLDEALMLQGILILVKGFSFVFFFNIFRNTSLYVRRGTFDTYLLRPISCLWLLVMDAFDEENIGQVLGGILLLGWAGWRLGWPVESAGSLAFSMLLALGGVIFFFSLAVLFTALVIQVVHALRLLEMVDISMLFASYPQSIFPAALSFLLTFFFPLFLISSLPAAALLGKPLVGAWGAIMAVMLFLAVSLAAWRASLARYASAGG